MKEKQKEYEVKEPWMEKAAQFYVERFNGKFALFRNLLRYSTHDYSLYRINIDKKSIIEAFLNKKSTIENGDNILGYVLFDSNDGTIDGAGRSDNDGESIAFDFWRLYNPYIPKTYFSENFSKDDYCNIYLTTKDKPESGISVITDEQAKILLSHIEKYHKAERQYNDAQVLLTEDFDEMNLE